MFQTWSKSSSVQYSICSGNISKNEVATWCIMVSTGALVTLIVKNNLISAQWTHISFVFLCRHPPLAPTSQYFADCWRYDRRIAHLDVSTEGTKDINCVHKFRIFDVVLSQWRWRVTWRQRAVNRCGFAEFCSRPIAGK